MTYVPRLAQSNYSWLGEGSVVYSTGNRPNTPFADNPALQQLQKPYKDVQVQRRASQIADKVARQTSRQGHVTVYDAVKRQYVSATPEEASFIREVNKEVASQRRASQQVKNPSYGGKTVKSGNQFISVTPQQVEAQVQRRASQTKKAIGTGNVTVYDAVKRQYVSATPEEASFIRNANKEVAAQRRALQGRKSILDRFGGKTVKVGDQYVAQSQYETARQYINNETARKIGQVEKQHVEGLLSKGTPLSPSVIDHNLGLDRTPKSAQESMGVFLKRDVEQALRQKTPLSPSVIDHNLGLDRVAKSARESAEAFKPENIVRQQTIQPRYGLQEFIDRSNGIGRQGISAQESAGAFIKHDIEQALSKKTPLNPSVLDQNLGLNRAVKSAEESASAFVEHGLTDTEKALGGTTKSKGLWGSIKGLFGKAKNALKTGWSKFTKFAKTPKGKWSLAIAAVALVGTALFGYIANRFSAKNRPTPTNGPDKLTMPKYENKVEESDDAEETDETKKSDKTDKTDKKESTGPSKVVMPIADADDDDEEIDDVDDVDADKSKVSDDDDEDVDDVDEVEKPDKAEATDEDDDEDVDEVDESKKTDKTKVADENDDEDVDESDQTKKADDVKKSDDTKKADDTEKKDEEDIDDEE